jgi:hypothetical protein
MPESHTLTFGKRRIANVTFDLTLDKWHPYDWGEAKHVPYWSGFRQYVSQELPCSCGGWAKVLSVHQALFSPDCTITINHLQPNRCRSCGRGEPMGNHYQHCSLLEVGDVVVNFQEEVLGTLGRRENGDYYLIPITEEVNT